MRESHNDQQLFDQYKQTAEAMAQELQEYVDESEEMREGTECLLEEFNQISNALEGFGKKQ